jgi:PIN domain nuclease of toxin-antitoxin system
VGVSFLLDTHVFLWLLGDAARVPTTVRSQLADPTNRLLVSAVSAFEVATKHRLGKLPVGGPLLVEWERRVASIRAEELELRSRHALLAGAMEWAHRDPFDRLLVAQALAEDATLVTSDAAVRRRGARTLWD